MTQEATNGEQEESCAVASIGDSSALKDWLNGRAVEFACVVAARAALRGAPVVEAALHEDGDARILAFDGNTVTFRHRKPVAKAADRPTYGTMTLPVEQFIQGFLMHRLPKGFHRIRHFGILANSCRRKTLETVLHADQHDAGHDIEPGDETAIAPACPRCGKATVPVATLNRNLSSEDLARTMEKIRMRGPP